MGLIRRSRRTGRRTSPPSLRCCAGLQRRHLSSNLPQCRASEPALSLHRPPSARPRATSSARGSSSAPLTTTRAGTRTAAPCRSSRGATTTRRGWSSSRTHGNRRDKYFARWIAIRRRTCAAGADRAVPARRLTRSMPAAWDAGSAGGGRGLLCAGVYSAGDARLLHAVRRLSDADRGLSPRVVRWNRPLPCLSYQDARPPLTSAARQQVVPQTRGRQRPCENIHSGLRSAKRRSEVHRRDRDGRRRPGS